ncbi:hypothetical protein LINPERPRIM_LOCUS36762 [Linum perenne]
MGRYSISRFWASIRSVSPPFDWCGFVWKGPSLPRVNFLFGCSCLTGTLFVLTLRDGGSQLTSPASVVTRGLTLEIISFCLTFLPLKSVQPSFPRGQLSLPGRMK